jgi:hypothetical protein
METQQMMELLLANLEKAEANRKVDCEALNEMSASIKFIQDLLARLETKTETNWKTD